MADDRIREVPFSLERDAETGDGLTLEGYAAVFNSPERIIDQEGEYDEVFLPGSFKRTIDARTPKLMYDHGRHPLFGALPIGSFEELREDPRGLYIRARLFRGGDAMDWLREAIEAQAIDGMSIRWEPEQQTWTGAGKNRLRTVRAAKLYELGPVTFPAYRDTSVMVRSLQRAIPDLAEYFRDTDVSTSEEPADSGTSDEPADGDRTPIPTSHAAREQMRRRLELDSLLES